MVLMQTTVADDVAMPVQHGLVHEAVAASMVHVANAISRSDGALVHELTQPAIHCVDEKG
jgi:hypothetical protein